MIVKRNTNNTAASAGNGWTVSGSIGIAQGPKGEKGDKGDSGDVIQQEILDDLQQQIENSKNFETTWGSTTPYAPVSKIADMPVSLTLGASAVVGDKMYFGLGKTETGAEGSMWEFNMTTEIWTKKATIKESRKRYYTECTVLGTKIYFTGGTINGSNAVALVDCYDTVTDKWEALADMPREKMYHAMCSKDGKIYAQGGSYTSGSSYAFEFSEYDPATNIWTEILRCPFPDKGHVLFAYEDNFYSTAANNSIIYKVSLVQGQVWESLGGGMYGKIGATIIQKDNLVYFAGKDSGPNLNKNIHCYNIATNEWSTSKIEGASDNFNLEHPAFGLNDETGAFYVVNNGIGEKFSFNTSKVTVSQTKDNSENISLYAGVAGQIVVNTDDNSIHIMDGTTKGGTKIGGAIDYKPDLGTVTEEGWVKSINFPFKTSAVSTFEYQEKLYSAGGYKTGEYDGSVHVFNPSSKTWIKKSAPPAHLYDCSSILIGNKFYVWGGRKVSDDYQSSATYCYDIVSDTWTTLLARLTYNSPRAAAVTLDGTIYNFGLYNNGEYIYKYDIAADTWTKAGEVPKKFCAKDCSAFVYQNRIHLIGGGAYNIKSYRKMLIWDVKTNTFTDGPNIPTFVKDYMLYMTCFIKGDKLIMIGGDVDNKFSNYFEYDFKTNEWKDLGGTAFKTSSASYTMLNDEIYMLAGYDSANKMRTDTLYKYIPLKSTPSHKALSLAKASDEILKNAYKGVEGELVINTKTQEIHLMDGKTYGGKIIGASALAEIELLKQELIVVKEALAALQNPTS